MYPNHWNMHMLKLKSRGFLLGRIVGWSQWEGNISFFILGLRGGGGGGFKNIYICFFFVWVGFFRLDCLLLLIYLFIIIIFRDCPFLVFGARGGKKGAILWTVDSPHCKCNVRGRGGGERGEEFFSRCFGRRWTCVYINF